MKKSALLFCFIVLFVPFAFAAPSGKPLPPLSVTIFPVEKNILPEAIRPGDEVNFRISAKSMIDSDRMNLTVELAGGLELVRGDTSWTGPVQKNTDVAITLTVRAPAKGAGKIKANVTIADHQGSMFRKEAQYTIGTEPARKSESKGRAKKDSKGRKIIEYQ